VLFSLAAVAHGKAIERTKDEPALAGQWELVGHNIEVFARTSLRGLR
jgi:hypothetical protein